MSIWLFISLAANAALIVAYKLKRDGEIKKASEALQWKCESEKWQRHLYHERNMNYYRKG